MDVWSKYDIWKTTPPDAYEKPCAECEECGAELYEGDEVIVGEDGYFCDISCVRDYYGLCDGIVERPEPDYDDYYDL